MEAITEARHAHKELSLLQETHSKTEKELQRLKLLYEVPYPTPPHLPRVHLSCSPWAPSLPL